MKPLIYGSVCSGVEAATLGWHSLGWRPAFFSEIEPAARDVLKHRWPNVPCHGDFTTIKRKDYEAIDLLVGGTPCQDFSIAGLRKGIAGDRGNLTLEFLRLADRLRPQWIVWENVPGVLSIDGGRAFGAFLGGLAKLRYGFAYRILDAQFYGVAQRRRRVFVVGYLGDWRPAAAVLFDRESVSGNLAPRREAREETSCDVRSGIAGTFGAHQSGGWGAGSDLDTCGAIIPETTHTLRGEGADASEDRTGRGTPLVIHSEEIASCLETTCHDYSRADGFNMIAFDCKAGGNTGFSISETPGTLRGEVAGGGHAAVAMAFESRIARNGRGKPEYIVPPLKARSGETGKGDSAPLVAIALDLRNATRDPEKHDAINRQGLGVSDDKAPTLSASHKHGVGTHIAVRRLTPRECERLMGMPDDHTLVPVGKKMMSDAARYKMIGNSMAVPVMRRIGERIDLIRKMMEETSGAN